MMFFLISQSPIYIDYRGVWLWMRTERAKLMKHVINFYLLPTKDRVGSI